MSLNDSRTSSTDVSDNGSIHFLKPGGLGHCNRKCLATDDGEDDLFASISEGEFDEDEGVVYRGWITALCLLIIYYFASKKC